MGIGLVVEALLFISHFGITWQKESFAIRNKNGKN